MVENLTAATYEQITTVLSQLATNYSNLAINFYDIFYNTVPMDVTIQMYDEMGVLQTYVIPNRAKDRTYILNGEGSPEGVTDAVRGSMYQDLASGNVYVKKTAGGSEGWDCFMSQGVLDSIIVQGTGSPEGTIVGNAGLLYVDTGNSELYIKTGNSSLTGWVLISANTDNLANRNLSNLSTAGLARFANPSLGNLSSAGEAKLNAKENVSNKVEHITALSTDDEYPSAKATYEAINTLTESRANKDFSNITESAVLKFLGQNQVKDCILSAPNGVLSKVSGNNVVFHQGTVALCANGMTVDRRINNTLITTTSDWPGTVPSTVSTTGKIFYDETNKRLWCTIAAKYFEATSAPSVIPDGIWYNPDQNKYYYVKTVSGASAWENALMVEVGRFTTGTAGELTVLEPISPIVVPSTTYILDLLKGVATKAEINQVVDSVQTLDQNKANKDLSNVTITSAFATSLNNAGIRVVTQSYSSGQSWYRVYSDGWCEQGGYQGSWNVKTFFMKSFANTSYTVNITPLGNHACYENCNVHTLQTDGFVGHEHTDVSAGYYWIAFGYAS